MLCMPRTVLRAGDFIEIISQLGRVTELMKHTGAIV